MEDTIHIEKKAGICPSCHKRNHPLALDVPGDICDDCQKKMLEKASIILCNHCKHISGFIQHGKTESGFEFVKGEVYHTENCKNCKPTLMDFKIIELEDYLKTHDVESDSIFTENKPGKVKEKKNGR